MTSVSAFNNQIHSTRNSNSIQIQHREQTFCKVMRSFYKNQHFWFTKRQALKEPTHSEHPMLLSLFLPHSFSYSSNYQQTPLQQAITFPLFHFLFVSGSLISPFLSFTRSLSNPFPQRLLHLRALQWQNECSSNVVTALHSTQNFYHPIYVPLVGILKTSSPLLSIFV